jgi:hypothetical protein
MRVKPLLFKDLKPGDKFILKSEVFHEGSRGNLDKYQGNTTILFMKLEKEVHSVDYPDGAGENCVLLSGGATCRTEPDEKVFKIHIDEI